MVNPIYVHACIQTLHKDIWGVLAMSLVPVITDYFKYSIYFSKSKNSYFI